MQLMPGQWKQFPGLLRARGRNCNANTHGVDRVRGQVALRLADRTCIVSSRAAIAKGLKNGKSPRALARLMKSGFAIC